MQPTYIAELWIHRSKKSEAHDGYHVLNISGYQVPMWLAGHFFDYADDTDWLDGLPNEKWLRVQFTARWEDMAGFGDPELVLNVTSWLTLPAEPPTLAGYENHILSNDIELPF